MKNKIKNIFKKFIKSIDKKDIIIFLIPLLMYGFYWVILYPGVLSYDSYNQLQQIEAMSFSSSHPFFHTFIEMILMRIWNTPAIVGLFQILFFCVLWTNICKYNRTQKNKNLFCYQILFTILICFNPLNKIISITLWKDVLYSYIILWLAFEIQKLIDKKFKINIKEVLKISLILVLIPSLRHNGYIITLFMSIILFILFIIYDKKSKNYLKLILFTAIFLFSFKGVEKIYDVKTELNIRQTLNILDYKLLSLTGEIGREGNVSAKEKIELNKYVNFERVMKYTKYNALDGIWWNCDPKDSYIEENHSAFYKLIGGLASKNKLVSIKYVLKETAFIWKIVRLDDSWGIINYYGINASNTDNPYIRPFSDTKLYDIVIKYLIFTRENKFFQTIFYSGSLCLYLSLIISFYLKRKHKINMFLLVMPIILNLISLVIAMPDNDVRYYYSSFLVFYLLGIIFLKYWVKNDEKK